MPRINVTIQIKRGTYNRPLLRTYIEHISFGIRTPGSALYITDNEGRVMDKDGNLGIDAIPNILTGKIDIRVICHNSVVRVPNTVSVGIVDHWKDFSVADGDTVTLTASNSAGNFDNFRILHDAIRIYERVFKPLGVWDGEFPLGKKRNLDLTRENKKRIEMWFISPAVPHLAYTEPAHVGTNYPVIHLGDADDRLFGTNGHPNTLISAELSHALHFSMLSATLRQDIFNGYVSFIVSEFLSGNRGTHSLTVETNPLVAFIEAFDHFATRFIEFARTDDGASLTGLSLRYGFLRNQLESGVFGVFNNGAPNGNLNTSTIVPVRNLYLTTGARSASSIEGSVFAAIFLDFARKRNNSLRKTVQAYVQSKALSFGEFRTWIHNNKPELRPQIDEVSATWTM
jgi:hypothetical protein